MLRWRSIFRNLAFLANTSRVFTTLFLRNHGGSNIQCTRLNVKALRNVVNIGINVVHGKQYFHREVTVLRDSLSISCFTISDYIKIHIFAYYRYVYQIELLYT